jgi:glutathione S-transferase
MLKPLLVIGTRNYSSWSLRPWLLLRHLGIAFEERVLHFGSAEFATEIARLSPSRRVPVLLDGTRRVWESVAICEYASELAGGKGWPADVGARAQARALAAEMHAGFAALRSTCPMNARARNRRAAETPALKRDMQRIGAIWSECRRLNGATGPWLFGSYSAADAMFAPVVLRIQTYGLPLDPGAHDYYETVLADLLLREWIAIATTEGVTVESEEVGIEP